MFTKSEIHKQLKNMHAPQNSIVLIHSSLRAIGETVGRGEGLLDALIEYFTADGGLLCIPTHTWANIYNGSKITLDLQHPKTCIGTLPDIAAVHTDAIRSLHPTHSMAVFGDPLRAQDFVLGEETHKTPASPLGCYGKIYDNNGYILLVGVGHNRNTYIHCIEEMLSVPNRLASSPKRATIRNKDGSILECEMHPHEVVGTNDISLQYPKFEPAFRYHNCIIDGKLGNAAAQLCSARKMKDVIELVYSRSKCEDLLLSDAPIDKKFYE